MTQHQNIKTPFIATSHESFHFIIPIHTYVVLVIPSPSPQRFPSKRTSTLIDVQYGKTNLRHHQINRRPITACTSVSKCDTFVRRTNHECARTRQTPVLSGRHRTETALHCPMTHKLIWVQMSRRQLCRTNPGSIRGDSAPDSQADDVCGSYDTTDATHLTKNVDGT